MAKKAKVKSDDKLKALTKPLRSKLTLPHDHATHHGSKSHGFKSKRIDHYQGKKIEIITTYKILIDGDALDTHTMVMNDGTVHNHYLPQYSFKSAIDMVKQIIRSQEKDYPEDELATLYEGKES